ncbi:PAS domain S-box protein [Balneolaceae bacterium YR4-1]|uniref:PAS domain S-box protein n=1 Tax=Halalkalibaculum roseum TaxID=2709311 RepID=A0A6M1SRI1_9BACT|nr:PAS domain S-box protein [Halalkalibaculum roseum]NGP75352.1 PAS domain S-box protein [Halalkalibaculum roseum]
MKSSSIHRKKVFDQTGRTEKPVVMVCLNNATDRELILQFLSDRYELIVGDCELGKNDFDVCLLDRPTFSKNREKMIAYKDSKAPLITPFILLVKGEHWSKNIDPVWNVVDEIVPIPTPSPILISRIETMLQLREHTLLLQKKNRKLAMYEQAMNAANTGITITDAREKDNPIIFINSGFEKMTGYSKEEVIGKNCRFLQKDDKQQDSLGEIRHFIANGKQGHAPIRNYRKDGTLFWNELRIAPITDSEGVTTHFVGIQNDITDLVQAQENLKKERNLFQKLAESSPVGIAIIDSDGEVTFVNEQTEKILGLPKSEILDLSYSEQKWKLLDDERNVITEDKLPFKRVLENEEALFNLECTLVRPGSTEKILSINAAPLKGQNGDPGRVVVTLSDITESKQRQKQLMTEKEFVRAVVNNMPGIFYMLDEDLNFVFWNKNMVSDLGYTDNEIEKMHALDFIRPEDHQNIIDEISRIYRTGDADVEIDLIDKQGKCTPYYLIGKKFEREGSTYIIGSALDITDRVDAEYKLEQQKKLLSAVINQTESIIYVKDKKGKTLLANQEFQKLFDPEFPSSRSKVNLEKFKLEAADQIRKNDQIVFETGELHEFKEQLPVGDEDRHYISIKYPLKDVPGFEDAICGISTDITEREQAYRQLREREKEKSCLYQIGNLNEIYDSVDKILNEAVDIIPLGWQYPHITEAAIEYNGKVYTTEGFKHTRWGMITESHNFKSKSVAVKVVYLEGKPTADEGPFLKEERELIDAIADTLASEIERIESRKKLEESEKRWQQLVQKNPGLVQIIDGDEIVFINPAGASLYGVDDVSELIGKSWTEFVQFEEDKIETVRQRISEAVEGKVNPPEIYRAWTADGTERFVELQSVPVQYKGKTVLMTVGQEVTERVKFERQLKKSLKEKEILLQEIHHRVKNNLAVISGLLQIQQFNSDDENVNKVLSNSEMRIKSMALIHEKLYQAESLSEIDFKYYIDDLIKAIEHTISSGEHITTGLCCESVTLNVNQAVPCALILNELITNSVEHGFEDQDSGEISVTLKERDKKVTVRVEDNGKGLPEDFDLCKSQTMGMTIIKTLITQLSADLKSGNDNGAFFEFTFEKKTIKGSSSTFI